MKSFILLLAICCCLSAIAATPLLSPKGAELFNVAVVAAPTAPPQRLNLSWTVPGRLLYSSSLSNWSLIDVTVNCGVVLTNRGNGFYRVPIDLNSGIKSISTNSLTVTWDASSDPNITNYNVYYGPASRTYTNSISVGTLHAATISGIIQDAAYFIAATAVNVLGQESPYSNEISYSVSLINSNSLQVTINPLNSQ